MLGCGDHRGLPPGSGVGLSEPPTKGGPVPDTESLGGVGGGDFPAFQGVTKRVVPRSQGGLPVPPVGPRGKWPQNPVFLRLGRT